MDEKVIEVIYNESEEKFVEKIKQLLTQICGGKENEELGIITFEETIKELNARIIHKTDSQKAGMIGELLFQIISYDLFKGYTHISLYFNQEERSVKKGFDLLLFQEDKVLYCEVKSKENGDEGEITDLHLEKLKEGVKDLKDKFSSGNTNYWYTAKMNIANIKEDALKKQIACILNQDVNPEERKDAVAVSVVFQKEQNQIEKDSINKYVNKEERNFKSLLAVSITHEDYKKIITILERLSNGN